MLDLGYLLMVFLCGVDSGLMVNSIADTAEESAVPEYLCFSGDQLRQSWRDSIINR